MESRNPVEIKSPAVAVQISMKLDSQTVLKICVCGWREEGKREQQEKKEFQEVGAVVATVLKPHFCFDFTAEVCS